MKYVFTSENSRALRSGDLFLKGEVHGSPTHSNQSHSHRRHRQAHMGIHRNAYRSRAYASYSLCDERCNSGYRRGIFKRFPARIQLQFRGAAVRSQRGTAAGGG